MSERPETEQPSDYNELIPGVPPSSSTSGRRRTGRAPARQPRRKSEPTADTEQTAEAAPVPSSPDQQEDAEPGETELTDSPEFSDEVSGKDRESNGTADIGESEDTGSQPPAHDSNAPVDGADSAGALQSERENHAEGANESASSESVARDPDDGGSRAAAPVSNLGGELLTPSGEDYGLWIDRSLCGARDEKSYSAPAISDRHGDILEDTRRSLRKLGYSRRQLSFGNLIELALETQADYVSRLTDEQARD